MSISCEKRIQVRRRKVERDGRISDHRKSPFKKKSLNFQPKTLQLVKSEGVKKRGREKEKERKCSESRMDEKGKSSWRKRGRFLSQNFPHSPTNCFNAYYDWLPDSKQVWRNVNQGQHETESEWESAGTSLWERERVLVLVYCFFYCYCWCLTMMIH